MKNYNIYFVLLTPCLVFAAWILGLSIYKQNIEILVGLGLAQIPLGLLQLATGAQLHDNATNYPHWVRQRITIYWKLTGGYMIALMLIVFTGLPQQVLFVWLYLVPWIIVTYQFNLIWRMTALRRRQLEKRELLQLS